MLHGAACFAPLTRALSALVPDPGEAGGQSGRPDIHAFKTAMRRAGCEKGFVVGFEFSGEAETEISRFFREEHHVIVPISFREILDDPIAHKLV